MSFTLSRRPNERVFRPVRLAGDALRGFDSPGSDDHIRVFFPDGGDGPDGATDATPTTDELRAFPSRELTPLSWPSAHPRALSA